MSVKCDGRNKCELSQKKLTDFSRARNGFPRSSICGGLWQNDKKCCANATQDPPLLYVHCVLTRMGEWDGARLTMAQQFHFDESTGSCGHLCISKFQLFQIFPTYVLSCQFIVAPSHYVNTRDTKEAAGSSSKLRMSIH